MALSRNSKILFSLYFSAKPLISLNVDQTQGRLIFYKPPKFLSVSADGPENPILDSVLSFASHLPFRLSMKFHQRMQRFVHEN